MSYLSTKFNALLLASIALIGCRQNEIKHNNNLEGETITLDVNDQKAISLSSLFDSIDCISFELTEGSEISIINKIIEQDQKYYVRNSVQMQNGKVLVFDSEGDFLYQVGKRGQGPGEYREVENFDINEKGEIIISDGIKIIKYDHDGNYIIQNTPVNAYEVMENDDKVIGLKNHMNKDDSETNLLFIMNERLEITDKVFSIEKKDFARINHYINNNNLSKNNDILYFSFPFRDMIYSLSGDSIRTAFITDFGRKSVPESIFTEEDIYKQISQKIKALGNLRARIGFHVTDNFVYLSVRDRDYNGYIYFYNRNNKQVLAGNGIIDDFCFGLLSRTLKAKDLPVSFSGDSILWVVEASWLIERYNMISQQQRDSLESKYPRIVELIENLDEDSNPVIFKMRVKNFYSPV